MLGLADGEFSVGLNDADRSYIADDSKRPQQHICHGGTTEGTKMLHRSTDNNIVFPDMPDEWTTDATRPPSIDEDFLINVGLHVHCQEYASGAKAIAIGNVAPPGAGSSTVTGQFRRMMPRTSFLAGATSPRPRAGSPRLGTWTRNRTT